MTTAFAHGLNALLESLGLDIGPDGEVFKTANNRANLGVHADRLLYTRLHEVLQTLEDAPEPAAADLRAVFGPLKPELEADIAAVAALVNDHPDGTIETGEAWGRVVRELRITSEAERTEIPTKERYRDELLAIERAMKPAGFTTGTLAQNVAALVAIVKDITDSKLVIGRMVNPAGWNVQLIDEQGMSGKVQYIDDMPMHEAVRRAKPTTINIQQVVGDEYRRRGGK